jgi:hypothetical protein
MERSGYWRVYAKSWNKANLGWQPSELDDENGVFGTVPPVYYGGRLLRLENYLAVPTFLRLGRRLAI